MASECRTAGEKAFQMIASRAVMWCKNTQCACFLHNYILQKGWALPTEYEAI
jgi:hypothetical protein